MSWLGVPDEPAEWRWPWRQLVGVGLTAMGMALCLAVLVFAMRGILGLGGFVAKGGPFVIAHEAPDWLWVAPVSIIVGMILGFANASLAHRASGFTLALPGWSAVFLLLGWNFAEYGLRGAHLVWSWILCAVLFFLLGLAPLLLLTHDRFAVVESARWQMRARARAQGAGQDKGPPAYRRAYLAINVGAVVVGGAIGTAAFLILAD